MQSGVRDVLNGYVRLGEMSEAGVVYAGGRVIEVRVGDREVLRIFAEAPPLLWSMQAYSQKDARWADMFLGTTYQTIRRWGCAMCCAAMIASQLDKTITPKTLNDALTPAGYNYINGGEAHLAWDRLPEYVPGLEWRGRRDWQHRLSKRELTETLGILAERPLILWVDCNPRTLKMDTHFVVGLGLTEGGEDLMILDPLDGAETRLLLRYGDEGHDLQRAIWGYRDLAIANV